ncbi:hypothetical protein ENKNEFLB_02266 [Nocardioides aquaticus]|uniref:DUF881 domain-containing protein n=1 Tax=Nocardioides aquaticus TaxID=160826 RepID=A0ABX8EJT2_9ACTN|nr:DUF881 domain-containing protein [Nocardioides aquaticus]QVT79876.1 hypothetical protein ENKNEFLB_02266 [Nocardioides aquaticus]
MPERTPTGPTPGAGPAGTPDPTGRGPAGRLPDRVTMPLLALVNDQALDEDYVVAAQRRRDRPAPAGRSERGPAGGAPPGRARTATAVTVAAVAVFGVLLATAAVQTNQDADVRDAGRAGLIDRVEAERARVVSDQDRVAGLRTQSIDDEARAVALAQDLSAETSRLRRLQTSTGFVAVRGEGVRATLDQAPDAGPTSQLRDSDLALLVNGLWSAGAEAVAVNGQRLTALSAIRTSGVAVEVNGVGIAPPYTVEAIGDRATLQADFYDTSSGLAFADLAARYAFDFEIENATDLALPSAPNRLQRLRSATTVPGPDPLPAPSSDPASEVSP